MKSDKRNDRLKRPKVNMGKLYNVYDWNRHVCVHGDTFLPTWDSTDHLQFACAHCKTIAEIGAVELRGSGETLAVFFLLECPKCGRSGQRKAYLRPDDLTVAFCHNVFDGRRLSGYATGRHPTCYKDVTLGETKECEPVHEDKE